MFRMSRIVSLVVAALVLQGCKSSMVCGLAASDRTAQQQLSSAWEKAVNAKNWDAVGATYAADAVLLPPNGPAIQGRENILAFFKEFPPFSDMKLQLVEIDGRCDMAYVRGVYSMTIRMPDHEPFHDTGKYLEIRMKQSNGSWLITQDMFSSDIPLSH